MYIVWDGIHAKEIYSTYSEAVKAYEDMCAATEFAVLIHNSKVISQSW